jgi:hypothetical protein
MRAHMMSSDALDSLALDNDSFNASEESFAHMATLPNVEEIEKLRDLYWSQGDRGHNQDWTSTMHSDVEAHDVPPDAWLSWPTFAKLFALIQRPANGAREHSAQQEESWLAAFRSIQAVQSETIGSGLITQAQVKTFIKRQRAGEQARRSSQLRNLQHAQGTSRSSSAHAERSRAMASRMRPFSSNGKDAGRARAFSKEGRGGSAGASNDEKQQAKATRSRYELLQARHDAEVLRTRRLEAAVQAVDNFLREGK